MAEHHWLFSKNPGHDFTRQHLGKLSFYDTMRLIISMGKGSTNDEIMDYFDLDPDLIPSQSAFCQRRRQISLSAFEYLFSEFSSSFPSTTDKFKDHCILACDGCHVVYATNSDIIEDYNKPRLIDYKGYNHMHLNGFVDVISKAFLDVVIQPGQQPDEREALHSMLDHFTPDDPQKYIITADRGYESYDLLFHCELKNLGYVFRVKSPSFPKSILSYYASELPDDLEEFDVTIKRFFTDNWMPLLRVCFVPPCAAHHHPCARCCRSDRRRHGDNPPPSWQWRSAVIALAPCTACGGADVAVAGMETKKGDPLWSRLLQKCISTLSFSLSKFSFCYPKAKDSHRDYTCAYV